MFIRSIAIESLGNSSYLVGSQEDGVAAVVDPVRDVDLYISAAEEVGVRILYSLETHIHNDFVSGARELAAQTGARVCAGASGGLVYPYIPLKDGDVIEVGRLKIGAMHTPGHTTEHMSYTVSDARKPGGPEAVFTGGALMAGNRAGPKVLGGLPRLFPLSPQEVQVRTESQGVVAVDARAPARFAEAHLPGAYSIPFGSNFAIWIGWVVPWRTPLLMVSDEPGYEEMVRHLIRIGYDELEGYLEGGVAAWQERGYPTASLTRVPLDDFYKLWSEEQAPLLLDVRQRNEWETTHIPGALNIELGALHEHLEGLPLDLPLATICASGVRSSTAASVLQREGWDKVIMVEDGVPLWEEQGYPVERGK